MIKGSQSSSAVLLVVGTGLCFKAHHSIDVLSPLGLQPENALKYPKLTFFAVSGAEKERESLCQEHDRRWHTQTSKICVLCPVRTPTALPKCFEMLSTPCIVIRPLSLETAWLPCDGIHVPPGQRRVHNDFGHGLNEEKVYSCLLSTD